MIVSTDVGGTFTDYVILKNGKIKAYKKINPPDVARGIMEEIGHANEFHHGTTVAINALLERKGSKVLLITTKGFETLYKIGRQSRKNVYSLLPQREKLPVDRAIGIEERTLFDGRIEKGIDEEELRDLLKEEKCESIAIAFLHSYANPENEIKAEKIVREFCKYVFPSYRVRREIREYERIATTVVEAYVYPIVMNYLNSLRDLSKNFYVMQSSGGKIMPEYLRGINTLMSGPSGGVAAASYLSNILGIDNVLTYDMGGTSADMGIIFNGKPLHRSSIEIDGIPIRVNSLDIISIGAGGGSIAWVDEGLALKVGPQSAGANPGPACYDRGGEDFTVTDANLLLGILGEEISGVKLNKDLARKAAKKLEDKIGLDVEELSRGMIKIVNNNMALAIKKISLSRGYDPRNFTLFAFGGAGPMHATSLAEEVGIKRVFVPNMAGAFSSLGILLSPLIYDYTVTVMKNTDEFMKIYEKKLREFTKRADKILGNYELNVTLDMRYRGQGHEIRVPLSEDIAKDFEKIHLALYGFNMDEEIVVVNINFIAVKSKRIEIPKMRRGKQKIMKRRIYNFEEEIPVYSIEHFESCDGPCVVEMNTATILVKENWRAEMNDYGVFMEMMK